MKRKLIVLLVLSFLILSMLTGCSSNVVNVDSVLKSPNSKLVDFEVVEQNFYGTILVDKNTNVLYYWMTSDAGGITPIYNQDGSLKLYEDR